MNLNIKAENNDMLAIFEATNQDKPKQKDIDALDKIFAENPHIWENVGNIGDRVMESIIKNDLGKNHLVYEATKKKLADLRDQLGWENSNQLEKVIIEQICLNWLRHNLLESVHSNKTRETHTVAIGNHWDKLLTQSQKRYLRAVESLAKVRKLLAEAELKEQQAKNKRSRSAALANKLLKDLTE